MTGQKRSCELFRHPATGRPEVSCCSFRVPSPTSEFCRPAAPPQQLGLQSLARSTHPESSCGLICVVLSQSTSWFSTSLTLPHVQAPSDIPLARRPRPASRTHTPTTIGPRDRGQVAKLRPPLTLVWLCRGLRARLEHVVWAEETASLIPSVRLRTSIRPLSGLPTLYPNPSH